MATSHRKSGPATTEKAVIKYHCKHCKVRVISRDNHHPVLGKQHKRSCPRARNLN